MAGFDWKEISGMPEDEQADAIQEAVSAMITEGATQEDFDEIERLQNQLAEIIRQRSNPN